MSINYEFFPLYQEQIESVEFQKLSSIKKCYYWLIQSMANKMGEFYFSDTNFAAALGCSYETTTKYRREFAKNGWIEIVPGKKDKQGRGLATVYKSVKWSRTPKQGDGLRFLPLQRYSFEMLLNEKLSASSVVIYICLTYWKFFHELDDGNFFITKSQLKKLSGIQSNDKVDSCIEELYKSFKYNNNAHLFEYEDHYHTYKFSKWSKPIDPSIDSNNRIIQKDFWQSVMTNGHELQKIKQDKNEKKQLFQTKRVLEYFMKSYKVKYGKLPSPFNQQVEQLAVLTNEFGERDIKGKIDEYFAAKKLPGISPTSRRTLKIFIALLPKIEGGLSSKS